MIIAGQLGDKVMQNENESYQPFIAEEFVYEPSGTFDLPALKQEARENPDTELAAMVRALFDLHTGQTEEIRLDVDEPLPDRAGGKR